MPYSGVNRIGRVLAAVTSIKNQANTMLGFTGTVQFDSILGCINQMHNANNSDLTPAISLSESQH